MSDWLGTYLLHSTVLLSLTLLLTRVVRHAQARDLLLKSALLVSLLTPTLASFRPSIAFPVQIHAVQAADTTPATTPAPRQAARPTLTLAPELNVPTRSFPLTRLLNALLLVGFVVAALRFTFGYLRLRRTMQEDVLDTTWRLALENVQQQLDPHLTHRVTLRWFSDGPPCAYGSHLILLPRRGLQNLTPAQAQAVTAHEYAHLLRRDPLWNAALSFITQVLWFQPLGWLVLRAWRDTAEELADRLATRATSPNTLAQTLLDLARLPTPGATSPIVTALRPTHLTRRVHALLRPPENPMKKRTLTALLTLPVLSAALLPTLAVNTAPLQGQVIVIDAAHGGSDPGVVANGIIEKEVVLKVALLVRAGLEKQGAKVLLTRQSDRNLEADKFSDLTERAKLAVPPARLFVSLHLNAMPPGQEARRGISALVDPESKQATSFADDLLRGLQQATGADAGMDDVPGSVPMPFLLRHAQVPAVLLELGYATVPADARLLADPAYQQKLADGIVQGLISSPQH